MKDVSAMVRRIDEEITANRQEIAARQVNIARLEDSRRVLMGLAESDIAHAEASRAEERKMLINGSGSGPVLIVRKTGSGGEKRPRSDKGKRRGSKPGASSAFSDQMVKLISLSKDGMKSRDVMDAMGEPSGSQRVYQTLHFLKMKGVLERDDAGTYTAVKRAEAPAPAAASSLTPEDLKERIHNALKSFKEPRPSGDIIKAALGVNFVEKGLKDRCYWALRTLKDKGLAKQQGGLYAATPVQ